VAARPRLIVALDCRDLDEARRIVEMTKDQVDIYKVGSILFTSRGPAAVEMVRSQGKEVFLDLKFHDIPNTVMGAVEAAAAMGVSLLTVHCSGGLEMMRAALRGAGAEALEPTRPARRARPKVFGVTVLTSVTMGEDTLRAVTEAARSAVAAGIDGVVCSPLEVGHLKRTFPDKLLALVPGIRMSSQARDDQARVGTPRQAARDGADFLVVGRSITSADRPAEALAAILGDIEAAGE
jgi:orotidine-5'-phosphate decarboxylase